MPNIEDICSDNDYILSKMRIERIFTLEENGDDIEIVDGCDDWYSLTLTKNDCLALSKLFNDLSCLWET